MKFHTVLLKILIISVTLHFQYTGLSAQINNEEIEALVVRLKKSAKGPYKAIRWFCPDGSTFPPDQRCPEPGGVQRAQYSDEVASLAKNNKLYLGQILSATKFEEFLDEKNQFSRMKQFQIETYLRLIDNGWINQRAKFYRGAVQDEDEQNWGKNFLQEILSNDKLIKENFYLLRSAAIDIPHKGDTKNAEMVRAISKNLSEALPSFLDLRVKLHGNPEEKDIKSVKEYLKGNDKKLNANQKQQFSELITELNKMFAPVESSSILRLLKPLPSSSQVKVKTESLLNSVKSLNEISSKEFQSISDILLMIRTELESHKKGVIRLSLLDLSITLENILFTQISEWKPSQLGELINKNISLAQALAGIGNLELWEWEKVKSDLNVNEEKLTTLDKLTKINEASKRIIEWSSSMVKSTYENEFNKFLSFEPLTHGFIDDKIRASILLHYGKSASELNEFVMNEIGQKNQVLNLKDQNQFRGLNPGYAKGELVVIKGIAEGMDFDSDKIYLFEKPPADLKPVAGLLTVSEGNLVSHIQLLARNLGIPNANLSTENLEELIKYNGKKVFYSVSPRGKVIMKLEKDMTETERNLFKVKKQIDDVFTVPTDKLKLNSNKIINMNKLRATDSGVLCGPKAANLGQLKFMFPENVVEGFVIPFGTFKEHLEQNIPGKKINYWDFLSSIFQQKGEMEKQSKSEKEVEEYTIRQLKELQILINQISLKQSFIDDLKNSFVKIFGKEIGKVGVFLRSDTNMEDLKDFTGAGLNLTLFNVLKEEEIIKGIKQVWASPFSERSYRWRQRILANPENVYPSILVIPGVNVESSGVMITSGVTSNNHEDITVAFNRGVGGAVEGQAAESYLIHKDKSSTLLSPTREMKYTVLSESGGTSKNIAYYNKRILSDVNLINLYNMSGQIKNKMLSIPGVDSKGPFDIELGFINSKISLFQVRPFVESKKAASSNYINSLDVKIDKMKKVKLDSKI